MFFTRIPINWPYFSDKAPDLTRAAWSFPLVGFLVGFLSGGFGELLILINVPVFISCVTAITISVLLTGAFHEDGLADMADGFGAGGKPEKINIDTIAKKMSLSEIPEPDLLIRTGGEKRLSNYLLWQLAYTELYFTEKYWPEFDVSAFEEALTAFSRRERRFGKTHEQIHPKDVESLSQ